MEQRNQKVCIENFLQFHCTCGKPIFSEAHEGPEYAKSKSRLLMINGKNGCIEIKCRQCRKMVPVPFLSYKL